VDRLEDEGEDFPISIFVRVPVVERNSKERNQLAKKICEVFNDFFTCNSISTSSVQCHVDSFNPESTDFFAL
jgi:phenylpyruvate tautomerase PptA (4-oxalocrotonate tautomerase family)